MIKVHLPALCLGLFLAVYWGAVFLMVARRRLTRAKSAQMVPRETLGRVLRLIWFPAIIAWVALPFAVACNDHPSFVVAPWPPAAVPALAWAGVIVGFLCLTLTIVCWTEMSSSWRMGIDPNDKTRLVVTGLFAYVRHPIYALSSLLMLATLAVVPSPALLATAVVHLALLQWEARREEHYLRQLHGQAYGDYCRQVGRWWPRSARGYGQADLKSEI